MYEYHIATLPELEQIWNKNIQANPEDIRWRAWKREYISYHTEGKGTTFLVLCDGIPVGEGTLLFSPECNAIRGRTVLADGHSCVNLNALRIEKAHEGNGHISKLVHLMEAYAVNLGYSTITIGVEAAETRNLSIYLHWNYNHFVLSEIEDDCLVLYYAKQLSLFHPEKQI